MDQNGRQGFWQRLKSSFRGLREEMYKNSVANAGPSEAACCHRPAEELERERARYRAIASERRSRYNDKHKKV